jgi:hypothetical protein
MGERVSYFDDEENVEEKWKDFFVQQNCCGKSYRS